MVQTGSITVKIAEDAIKERMRDFLAAAWDEGFHEGRANVTHNKPCDGRLWYDDDGLDDNPYRQ